MNKSTKNISFAKRYLNGCSDYQCSSHGPWRGKTFLGFFILIIFIIFATTLVVEYKHTTRLLQPKSKQNAKVFKTYFVGRQLSNLQLHIELEERDCYSGNRRVLRAKTDFGCIFKRSVTVAYYYMQGESCYSLNQLQKLWILNKR